MVNLFCNMGQLPIKSYLKQMDIHDLSSVINYYHCVSLLKYNVQLSIATILNLVIVNTHTQSTH